MLRCFFGGIMLYAIVSPLALVSDTIIPYSVFIYVHIFVIALCYVIEAETMSVLG